MKRLKGRKYWRGFFDGFDQGISNGVDAANYMLLLELKRIGSTGDNFEAKWSDVEALFPTKIIEKINQKDVYF